MDMTKRTRRIAGIIAIALPTVAFGGISLLTLILSPGATYGENPLRQDLWRAGHAHAGVLLILSLVVLKYVDEALLPEKWKHVARLGVPLAAIIMPIGFFFSMVDPQATKPNELIYLTYAGFAFITVSLITLGVGLLRK